jgi:2-polyprenyl-3-methyl-5-hydroxy-6-metoxy-1,4-benzoquinol methylase
MSVMLSEAELDRFGRTIWPDLVGRPATALNQAKFGLSRVLPVFNRLARDNFQVLEVGAGSMLLSAYLASKGLNVTALEPLTPDFSWFEPLQMEVLAYCAREGVRFERVDSLAEEYITPGRYDVIFTIHVLEHMKDPLRALENMYRSLKQPGFLLAVCPNYDVPFEPHLGIFLVGRSKSLNARLYAHHIAAKSKVWDGLFFIRYSRLRQYLNEKRIRYAFNRSMVRDMFQQLEKDQLFYARMPRFVRWSHRILKSARVIDLLYFVPLRMQTPMELLVTK